MKVNSRPKSQVLGREQADDRDQDRAEEDQAAGEVGKLGGQLDAEMIDQRLGAGDDDQEDRLGGQIVLDAERRTESADEERPGADIDGAEHGDQAEQVEPGRHPAGAAIAQDRAPVIEAACGRIGGADLRHGNGERRATTKQPTSQPMPMPMPPAPDVACASELMPPERMQMIEKETAKFEKRLSRRSSSWA